MLYLFILESIGTSELILIGLIALIVLGPRKLPEVARKIGRTMADFRQTTNEFKRTWAQEANFNDEIKDSETKLKSLLENPAVIENSNKRTLDTNENKILSPEIRKVNQENITEKFTAEKIQAVRDSKVEKVSADKRDWL
jgi:Tat protein translocase TatB subunit